MILSAHRGGHSVLAGDISTVTDRWPCATRARDGGRSGLHLSDHAVSPPLMAVHSTFHAPDGQLRTNAGVSDKTRTVRSRGMATKGRIVGRARLAAGPASTVGTMKPGEATGWERTSPRRPLRSRWLL